MANTSRSILIALLVTLALPIAAAAESPFYELHIKGESLPLRKHSDDKAEKIALLDQRAVGHIIDIAGEWYSAEFILGNQKRVRGFVRSNEVSVSRKNIIPTDANAEERRHADLLERKMKTMVTSSHNQN
jgi:hypothetical protein